ncbi:PLD nuclease N-terminal domain-containing protein [Streptomyces qinzhouensis]|uniref:PLDc_N domain-containing protein n=1 Tax=Streptomyces qinzhouensis TaxID=2599401 RepID=A0A5B8J9B5_9ACTN|nr:PLD nuclease N-terminal domain-containing protein [Streptomyces qinzhouensis]QDY78405.1 PLDc_N domain-containing protein [Streptomyces qinzhouensis]
MLRYLPFLLVLALWIYAFIDVLNTPEKEVRNLPKVAWVIIVLLFGEVLLGPIAWFVAGRPRRTPAHGGGGGSFSPGGRRGGGWVAPDDNPDFLKSLDDEGRKKDQTDQKDEEPGSDGPK